MAMVMAMIAPKADADHELDESMYYYYYYLLLPLLLLLFLLLLLWRNGLKKLKKAEIQLSSPLLHFPLLLAKEAADITTIDAVNHNHRLLQRYLTFPLFSRNYTLPIRELLPTTYYLFTTVQRYKRSGNALPSRWARSHGTMLLAF